MALIDSTYFNGPLSIAQKTQQAVFNNLNWYIIEYESKYLEQLLGYEFYKLFLTGVDNSVQKYLDILDGKEYTDSAGILRKWKGLRYAEGGINKSPIANYVYYHLTVDNYTQTTGAGEKKVDTENSVEGHPKLKLARAWNDMVNINRELVEFLTYDINLYPEFWNHISCNQLDNLISKVSYLS